MKEIPALSRDKIKVLEKYIHKDTGAVFSAMHLKSDSH